MNWKIKYSASSREDLKSIFDYIAYELLSPEYAAGQIERILKAVRSLENMPKRCSVYSEEPWKTKQVRFLPVDNYIVFYLPKDDSGTVNIIRIIYGGRDMKRQIMETKVEL
ncbi:MAG: type II toxin-antitoxin system RelE/ParE family toxin [Lachnospiraceae bacterium]|nr:type II toxin-antitoxin system RelE/ParE family toxin [Lachnospiraceae bacterium]